MSVIEIIGKHKGTKEVLDDANNKKDAKQQVSYWQKFLGKGWKIYSKPT